MGTSGAASAIRVRLASAFSDVATVWRDGVKQRFEATHFQPLEGTLISWEAASAELEVAIGLASNVRSTVTR